MYCIPLLSCIIRKRVNTIGQDSVHKTGGKESLCCGRASSTFMVSLKVEAVEEFIAWQTNANAGKEGIASSFFTWFHSPVLVKALPLEHKQNVIAYSFKLAERGGKERGGEGGGCCSSLETRGREL